MCSGKVYYELAKKRAELKKEKEVAIIRLEQVSVLHSCFVHQSCSLHELNHNCRQHHKHFRRKAAEVITRSVESLL